MATILNEGLYINIKYIYTLISVCKINPEHNYIVGTVEGGQEEEGGVFELYFHIRIYWQQLNDGD